MYRPMGLFSGIYGIGLYIVISSLFKNFLTINKGQVNRGLPKRCPRRRLFITNENFLVSKSLQDNFKERRTNGKLIIRRNYESITRENRKFKEDF